MSKELEQPPGDLFVRLKTRYPGRVPVVCLPAETSSLPELQRGNKLMVTPEMTVAQISVHIRKTLKLAPEHAIYLFVGRDRQPSSQTTIGHLYDEYGNKEGFLCVRYAAENTFGAAEKS